MEKAPGLKRGAKRVGPPGLKELLEEIKGSGLRELGIGMETRDVYQRLSDGTYGSPEPMGAKELVSSAHVPAHSFT